jgi:peptidyl-prolyl cis-trans isomerase B (cyclophilin B)
MKRRLILALALFAPFAFAQEEAKKEETKPAEAAKTEEVKDIKIKMVTTKGDIEATIFASKVPVTAANFLNLAKRGYYNGIAFHRVIENFMVQGGDPTESGRGGPGYKFADEFHADLKHSKPGIFSMANAGPGTNGSQFFITMAPTPFLDNRHSVFGEVTKGQDVVNKLLGKVNTGEPGGKVDPAGKGDKIEKIEILDSTDALFAAQKSKIDDWDAKLKAAGK